MNNKNEFDISKDDFDISKRSVVMLLDQLIEEYSDFTRDVSPKNWRLTGHHISDLKKIKNEIEDLTPISVEEKENDWVKSARNESLTHIKKFESFEKNISHISELKIGDNILYQGSKCEVLTEDDFSVRVKSLQTNREFTINQGQLQENGVRFA